MLLTRKYSNAITEFSHKKKVTSIHVSRIIHIKDPRFLKLHCSKTRGPETELQLLLPAFSVLHRRAPALPVASLSRCHNLTTLTLYSRAALLSNCLCNRSHRARTATVPHPLHLPVAASASNLMLRLCKAKS